MMVRPRTDLPEPDSPTMPRVSPAETWIETPSTASYGPARMYTRGYSYCNLLDLIKPSESEPWVLAFDFGEYTRHEPPPASFGQLGARDPVTTPTR